MRTIDTHRVNGLNEPITITVLDKPGAGGACHAYRLTMDSGDKPIEVALDIHFQHGPIAEEGVNGISNASLLAVVRDRLESFQAGPYACIENAVALASVTEAMAALCQRTEQRLARGVEGTSTR